MNEKTHLSALVIIPSESAQVPIQALRERHDKQAQRWMPHINLLYPFRPLTQFNAAEERIAHLLASIKPFEVTFSEVRLFSHQGGAHTLWLMPEPHGALVSLQKKLQKLFRDCDDTARQHGGYTPHLSIGQVHGHGRANKLLAELNENWQPISFPVEALSLIARGEPPKDQFRVERRIRLGVKPVRKIAAGAPARTALRSLADDRGADGYRPRSRSGGREQAQRRWRDGRDEGDFEHRERERRRSDERRVARRDDLPPSEFDSRGSDRRPPQRDDRSPGGHESRDDGRRRYPAAQGDRPRSNSPRDTGRRSERDTEIGERREPRRWENRRDAQDSRDSRGGSGREDWRSGPRGQSRGHSAGQRPDSNRGEGYRENRGEGRGDRPRTGGFQGAARDDQRGKPRGRDDRPRSTGTTQRSPRKPRSSD